MTEIINSEWNWLPLGDSGVPEPGDCTVGSLRALSSTSPKPSKTAHPAQARAPRVLKPAMQ